MTIGYDEPQLVAALAELPLHLRVAFAAGCAERLYIPARAELHDDAVFRQTLDRVWSATVLAFGVTELQNLLAAIEPWFQPVDDYDQGGDAQADDAEAALAYALRAQQSGSAQEAAYAARCGYETADYLADGDLTSAVVQAELRAQHDDLQALRELAALSPVDAVARYRERFRPSGSTQDQE